MVASIFVIQGYETFRRPDRVAPRAESVVRPLAERIPAVPAKTEDAVRLNAAIWTAPRRKRTRHSSGSTS